MHAKKSNPLIKQSKNPPHESETKYSAAQARNSIRI